MLSARGHKKGMQTVEFLKFNMFEENMFSISLKQDLLLLENGLRCKVWDWFQLFQN